MEPTVAANNVDSERKRDCRTRPIAGTRWFGSERMNHPNAKGHSLSLIVVLSLIAASSAVGQTVVQPNIVLIVADYMGYSDIGPYGATDIRTPSLDSLADGGVRFSSYYSASPVCGPSRAALLSGFYPARVGVEANIATADHGLSSSDSTLVRELKAGGYRTAMVGKWHLGVGSDFLPNSHGFDSFFGFHSWTLGYHDHRSPGGEPGLYRNSRLVSVDGYLTDVLTNEAVRFIEEDPEDPFFLYLAYNTGLPPYQRPDLPESQWSYGWDANEATREDYVAMVEAMDRGIGRVLSKLEELELTDNTLLIFTYDHGGRHLVRSAPLFHGFGTLWEGGIRVPLLVQWPIQFSGGQVVERPSIAMDLTATMLSAAGRDLDELELDGSSLLPVLRNEREASAQPLFWRITSPLNTMWAVRQENWKYVVDRGTQLLFDLDTDIGERNNLFAAQPEVVRELRAALRAWEQSLPARQ